MKKSNFKRWLAAVLTAALFTGTLGACGIEDDKSGNAAGSDKGIQPIPQKGRYVETEEPLPEGPAGQTPIQLFAADGKLHLLTEEKKDEKSVLREWEKQENGFVDVTQGWLSSLEFDCAADWLEAKLFHGADGSQYLYTGYLPKGGDSFQSHLWKGSGDNPPLEITPEKWSVPGEDAGGFEMIQGMAALDNGTLVALSYTSLDILSCEDGSILESEPLTSFYEGGVISDGKFVYLCSSEEGGRIEKRKDGKNSGLSAIPYPTGGSDNGSFVVGGSGSLALCVLKNGILIAAGEDGIFRQDSSAADSAWEKLAEGMDTDFSISNYYCLDMAAAEDGCIYALFQADERLKLNRYEYDPEAVSEITQVLKLYSVYESSLLKQAAALYHRAHPNVLIDIEYEYPMYSYDTPDYDAVYKKLNTVLLGEDAPDILIMDHLNLESYVSKGLLEDLSGIIKPLEENGSLLSNITGAYVQDDGSRYAVPLQFGFTLALGRDISAENMSSIKNLADFLSKSDYSYLGSQTPGELVDKFYPYFCNEIIDGKQLDRDALGTYLEYLKNIGDNCGIISSRRENERCFDMWDLSAQAKLAFDKAAGFMDCMSPMSMVDYIKGDFAAFENRFRPFLQTGICTKTQYMDTAKDFLLFALSDQVQDLDFYDGFPVNKASMQKQAEKDRSMYTMSTLIEDDNGGFTEFMSNAYPQKTADKIIAMCEGLDKPVMEDEKVREVLTECLGGYLDGTQSKEDTVQKIEDGLKMYLAE